MFAGQWFDLEVLNLVNKLHLQNARFDSENKKKLCHLCPIIKYYVSHCKTR